MPGSRSSALYFRVVDLFRADPGPWDFAWAQWSIRGDAAGGLPLTVSLDCDGDGVAGAVEVRAGPSLAASPAAARDLTALARLLARRGYGVRPATAAYPLVASRRVPPGGFGGERRFLASLARADPGAVAARPRSTLEFLDAFRGRRAGAWRPAIASWEWRRPLHLAGRPALAVLVVHLAPEASGRLGATSCVSIRPPWEVCGPLPGRLAAARRLLDGQLRAAGHEPEWHRPPDGRGAVVTTFRALRGLRAIAAERRRLEAARLGDGP